MRVKPYLQFAIYFCHCDISNIDFAECHRNYKVMRICRRELGLRFLAGFCILQISMFEKKLKISRKSMLRGTFFLYSRCYHKFLHQFPSHEGKIQFVCVACMRPSINLYYWVLTSFYNFFVFSLCFLTAAPTSFLCAALSA